MRNRRNSIHIFPLDLLGRFQRNGQALRHVGSDVPAAHGKRFLEDDSVAFHSHHVGAQIADIDQDGGAVAVLLQEVEHRLARGAGEKAAYGDVHVAQAGHYVIQEKGIGHHEADQGLELGPLEPYGLQRLFAAVHHEPCGAAVHHHAAHGRELLVRIGKDLFHMAGRNMRVRPLNGHAGLHGIHARKFARYAHVDLADLALGLGLGLGDGFLDGLVEHNGVVPFAVQKAVVGGDSRPDDVATLSTARLGYEGNDLARTKINGRDG